jgi:hypothetical protein
MAEAIGVKNSPHRNPWLRSCPRRFLINLRVTRGWAPHLSVYSPSCLAFNYSSNLVCGSYSKIACCLGKPSVLKQP